MHLNIILPYFSSFFTLLLLLGLLLHSLNCWPVNSISDWFSTSTEDWERIEIWIHSKNLSKVIRFANVILTFIVSPLFVEIFNSGLVIKNQFYVEFEETCHKECDTTIEKVCKTNDGDSSELRIRSRKSVIIKTPLHRCNEIRSRKDCCEICNY